MFPDKLTRYINNLVPPRPQEMQAMEVYAAENGFPIIGPAAGHMLYQICRISQATRIFELGSGYGYSTAWFAKAVQENGGGVVHHVVWDENLSSMAQNHLGLLGYGDIVHYTVGEAVQALRDSQGPFDVIFNDIEKEGYPESISVIAKKLRPGGILFIDNMLWSGRVYAGTDQSESTKAIVEVTQILANSQEWITSIIPIRDGVMMAYKK